MRIITTNNKYASTKCNTLTSGELSIFLIQIKATILAETCTWYRKHYAKCPFSDYEKILINIHGYKMLVHTPDKWFRENSERWEKDQLKCTLTQKLQNLFIQQYRTYLNEESNSDKCHLAKTCDKGVYKMSQYYYCRQLM